MIRCKTIFYIMADVVVNNILVSSFNQKKMKDFQC